MKRLLVVLLPLVLAACASAPPLHVDVPDIARSASTPVRDERPASETKREAFSLLITSDAYGIFRNGEMRLDPAPLRLLQHRAFERVGANSNVVVHHFVTYQNLQAQLRGTVLGAVLLGPVGAIVGSHVTEHGVDLHVNAVDPAAFEALAGDNEWKRGVVSAAENPKKGATYVTYLDAEFQGRRAAVRVVAPVAVEGRNGYGDAVDATIQQWFKLLDSGGQALPAAPAPVAAVAPVAAPAPVAAVAEAPPARTTLAAATAAAASTDYVRHLDARTVDGTEWTFPSWNTQTYRDVHLVFRNGKVNASNQRDHTSGTYTVAGDQVCVDLQSKAWGKQCYVVVEATSGEGAHGLQVVAVPNGDRLPLVIR